MQRSAGPTAETTLVRRWSTSQARLDGPFAIKQHPSDGSPLRQGYGRELIERALPYQLGAETSYELTPEGVRCTITLPISTTHREAEHA